MALFVVYNNEDPRVYTQNARILFKKVYFFYFRYIGAVKIIFCSTYPLSKSDHEKNRNIRHSLVKPNDN